MRHIHEEEERLQVKKKMNEIKKNEEKRSRNFKSGKWKKRKEVNETD